MLLLCSPPVTITDEDMRGEKKIPSKDTCSYENYGSVNKSITPEKLLRLITDRAETHCKSLGGLNFEKTQINAFERPNPNGGKLLLWNEVVFCNCSE
jgi:hypothetical protein